MSHGNGQQPEAYEGWDLVSHIALIVLVVCFSGSCSGMTVGLFALDASHLKVKARSGTAWQQSAARRVLFFVERAHWSLCTLLVSNALAMTTLPILLDVLVSPTIAVIVSVTAVLFFGEVIPQALFVRHGFTVISWLTPLLFLLLVATSPFSYPCAKILDYVVGHQALAARDEIERHVRIAEGLGDDDGENDDDGDGGGGGALLPEEVQVMRGALSISKKTLKDIQGVALADAFMLPSSSEISQEIVNTIVQEGKSRVPVYRQSRSHVIGVLLTKTLLSYAYQFHVPNSYFESAASSSSAPAAAALKPPLRLPKIGELPLREPFRMQEDAKVSDLLNSFKTGQSHLAAVYNRHGTLVKFVTLDDIFQLLHSGGEKASSGGRRKPHGDDEKNADSDDLPKDAGAGASRMSEGHNVNRSEKNERDLLVASAFNAIRESVVGSSST